MTSTRSRILAYLKSHQPASVREIARALNLTDPDVFYHIQAALEEGEIELVGDSSPLGKPARRGRPFKRYRLIGADASENFAFLLLAALSEYLARFPSAEEKTAALRALARHILPSPPSGKTLNARLTMLTRLLSDRKYAARWEARAAGPRVIFDNCPYLKVAEACPALCEMDRLVLEESLGLPVSLLQRFFDEGNIPRQCRFSLSG